MPVFYPPRFETNDSVTQWIELEWQKTPRTTAAAAAETTYHVA